MVEKYFQECIIIEKSRSVNRPQFNWTFRLQTVASGYTIFKTIKPHLRKNGTHHSPVFNENKSLRKIVSTCYSQVLCFRYRVLYLDRLYAQLSGCVDC